MLERSTTAWPGARSCVVFPICTEMSDAAKLIVTNRLYSFHILHPSISYHSQSQSCHVAPNISPDQLKVIRTPLFPSLVQIKSGREMGHSWLKVSTVVNCSSYVSIFALSIKRRNREGNDNKHYFCQQIPSMGQTQFREETQIQSLESFSFVLLISITGICFHTVFQWNNGYVWLPLLKKLILSVNNSIPP